MTSDKCVATSTDYPGYDFFALLFGSQISVILHSFCDGIEGLKQGYSTLLAQESMRRFFLLLSNVECGCHVMHIGRKTCANCAIKWPAMQMECPGHGQDMVLGWGWGAGRVICHKSTPATAPCPPRFLFFLLLYPSEAPCE